MKLSEIARHLGANVDGNGATEISGVAGIAEAVAGQITFLANRKYAAALKTTRASAIIISKNAGPLPLASIRSENPYLDFARTMELFYQAPKYAPGIHATSVVSPKATIGDGAHIGPHCFVDDDVQIGRNAVLHSFVSIYRGAHIGDDFFAHSHSVVREFCRIGNRVLLQNGVIIGSDGFGFAKQADGRWYKMQQTGIAIIEDDVEIQAQSCVDRATLGETRIHRGAKLDNLVQVGHASKVGEDSLLCGQVGLAGSTVVGNRCILAGQVGVAGHLEIGDGAVLTAQSGVPADVPAGALYSGYPAMDNRQWLKCAAAYQQLPDLVRKVRQLQQQIEELQK